MDTANKIASWECRFLDESYFGALYTAFIEAFSDYTLRFDLTEQQFRNHITLNAVDIRNSLGVFIDGRLSGFTLNGFGDWRGLPTVYDAGTGVLPDCRRNGIGTHIFDVMIPIFISRGLKQILLEVITTNHRAIGLYRKLGFQTVRELAFLEANGGLNVEGANEMVEVAAVAEPDWTRFRTFWDAEPSWQNSVDAIERSRANKTILAARIDGEIVGYIIFSTGFGRVAQIAVKRDDRRRGIGTRLLKEMAKVTDDAHKLSIINADTASASDIKFFNDRGFVEKVRQFEMLKQL